MALMLVLLSACTGLGNPDQTKACRALADQVPGISGVKDAAFTDSIVSSLPQCAGVVALDPGLTTQQRGQVVGSVYDLVRTRGVKEVEFSTQFSWGAASLSVNSGFPTADQATGVLAIADTAHADSSEITWSLATGLVATEHVRLASTTPAASLREATALLVVAPPTGVHEIDWYLNDTQVVAPTITADDATRLGTVASWFDKNPAVTSYSLKDDSGVRTWALTTSSEVPDVVRDFASVVGAGSGVKVTGSLAGKAPYVTVP
jgi:hypothetical protein